MEESIDEVTNSVAREMQFGSSQTKTSSDASQSGNSQGAGLIGYLIFVNGISSSNSSNHSVTTSVSRTSGTRNLSSRNNRQINGSTHQQANAVRGRLASVVQETYET